MVGSGDSNKNCPIIKTYERTPAEKQMQADAAKRLDSLLDSLLGDKMRIELYGSCANGFDTKGSDVDVSVNPCGAKNVTHEEKIERLREISTFLEGSDHFKDFRVLSRAYDASVPILKLKFCKDRKRLGINLSIQNTNALESTKHLKRISGISHRVKEVVCAIKKWTKEKGVNGARDDN